MGLGEEGLREGRRDYERGDGPREQEREESGGGLGEGRKG